MVCIFGYRGYGVCMVIEFLMLVKLVLEDYEIVMSVVLEVVKMRFVFW